MAIDRSVMCDLCIYQHTSERGEWQCQRCAAHYYTWREADGTIHTARVYDREDAPDNTAALALLDEWYATPDDRPPGYWDELIAGKE
jgi:hypothetical protein